MRFNPDYSLIKEWNGATSTLPCEAPFVSQFNLASKMLHYIAARHGGDIDSPTLKTGMLVILRDKGGIFVAGKEVDTIAEM